MATVIDGTVSYDHQNDSIDWSDETLMTTNVTEDSSMSASGDPVMSTLGMIVLTSSTMADGMATAVDSELSTSFESTPLGVAVAVPVAVVAASCMICAAVGLDRRLHQMCYYYYLSLAALNSLMAVTVLPAAVYVVTAGFFSFSDASCKLWISGDLFFCNNVCLHMAFINMDAFLRLKDPRHRRGRRVATGCSLLLWLGAPWSVSLVQSVAQFMLSQADPDSRSPRNGLCFIADKNFVILGALFAFFVPLSVAVVFAVLCQAEVRMVERRLYSVTQQVTSRGHVFMTSPFPDYQPEVDQGGTASDDGLSIETSPGNDSLSSTCANSYSGSPVHSGNLFMECDYLVHDRLRESTLTLTSEIGCETYEVEERSSQTEVDSTECHLSESEITDRWPRDDRRMQQTTSFCDVVDNWRHVAASHREQNAAAGTCSLLDEVNLHATTPNGRSTSPPPPPVAGQLSSANYSAATYVLGTGRTPHSHATPPFDNEDSYFDDDVIGAKLLTASDANSLVSPSSGGATCVAPTAATAAVGNVESSAIADEGLRQELDLFRTTRVLLTSTIVLWLPLTVANVVYATCESCRSAMTVGEVMTVKWIAYVSPLVAAATSIWCSEVLRHAVRSALTRCCSCAIAVGGGRRHHWRRDGANGRQGACE